MLLLAFSWISHPEYQPNFIHENATWQYEGYCNIIKYCIIIIIEMAEQYNNHEQS
jgi:hypothetical protein